jgi:hypothetical protein
LEVDVNATTKQILALCPADGWFAIYRNPDGSLFASRVTVWAAVRESSGVERTMDNVYGIEMGGEEAVTMPLDADNLAGYLHERDLGDIPIAADSVEKEPTP